MIRKLSFQNKRGYVWHGMDKMIFTNHIYIIVYIGTFGNDAIFYKPDLQIITAIC